jgi:hypothetical protein
MFSLLIYFLTTFCCLKNFLSRIVCLYVPVNNFFPVLIIYKKTHLRIYLSFTTPLEPENFYYLLDFFLFISFFFSFSTSACICFIGLLLATSTILTIFDFFYFFAFIVILSSHFSSPMFFTHYCSVCLYLFAYYFILKYMKWNFSPSRKFFYQCRYFVVSVNFCFLISHVMNQSVLNFFKAPTCQFNIINSYQNKRNFFTSSKLGAFKLLCPSQLKLKAIVHFSFTFTDLRNLFFILSKKHFLNPLKLLWDLIKLTFCK